MACISNEDGPAIRHLRVHRPLGTSKSCCQVKPSKSAELNLLVMQLSQAVRVKLLNLRALPSEWSQAVEPPGIGRDTGIQCLAYSTFCTGEHQPSMCQNLGGGDGGVYSMC